MATPASSPEARGSDPDQHPRPAVVGPVALRTVGMYAVASVMFATFVNSENATDHALAVDSWLTTVALTGIFCAAWVARDVTALAGRQLVRVWLWTLGLVVVLLAVSALLTDNERSRADGVDVLSAFTTSGLIGLGLVVAAALGVLCGRAAQRSRGAAVDPVASRSAGPATEEPVAGAASDGGKARAERVESQEPEPQEPGSQEPGSREPGSSEE